LYHAKEATNMKAAGYVRVSSQDQIEGTSLEAQKDQINNYAAMKGIELVEIYQDAGISGFKPMGNRPEGKKLLSLIQDGSVQAVIIVKLDRAFRNTVDCLQTVESWEKTGVALHIIDLGGNSVDTNSPAGKFMLTVLAAAAEMERGMIRDRCNSGRKMKKAQGCRIGEIPFGFNLESDTNKLVMNPEEQKVIEGMAKRLSEGHSFRKIAVHLNKKGIKTKKGGEWTHRQVAAIMKRAA
jgi:site-specific DNA recombinase